MQRVAQAEADAREDDSMDEDDMMLVEEIRTRRKQLLQEHRTKKSLHAGNSVMPRSKLPAGDVKDMQVCAVPVCSE